MYLDTNSVESAYNQLSKIDVKDDSLLHIFFILKGCGFNTIEKLSVSLISNLGMPPAFQISSLYSPQEQSADTYDFISPFHMGHWKNQSPSEPLKKWVSSRIKNNVIGGATTWRKILLQESFDDDELIKFSHEYIYELKTLSLGASKINFFFFSIWSLRFTKFEKKYSFVELGRIFKAIFKLTEQEEFELFQKESKDLKLHYSNETHDAQHIRRIIGKPPKINHSNEDQWFQARKRKNENYDLVSISIENNEELIMKTLEVTSQEKIFDLLSRNYQLILSGPPGTSKSFIAKSIGGDSFKGENITRIQFHPGYSYQDFIGGYIVEGSNVRFEKGIFLKLVEQAKKAPDNDFLLIIDELNRANVSQVFGETIQCLDRGYDVQIRINAELQVFSIPKNLKIIATMNTADRTLGILDFAMQRRFVSIYCPPDYDLLYEKCDIDFNFSAGDFLKKINLKIIDTLKNKELMIGHAIFLDNSTKQDTSKYFWNKEDFEDLFNYKILPILEEYTKGQNSDIRQILGETLANQLKGVAFIDAIESFCN